MGELDDFPLDIEKHDSTPTLKPVDIILRIRQTDLAVAVEQARQQGYIEASVATQALDLIKQLVPLLGLG